VAQIEGRVRAAKSATWADEFGTKRRAQPRAVTIDLKGFTLTSGGRLQLGSNVCGSDLVCR
jgi:hypothetical protein